MQLISIFFFTLEAEVSIDFQNDRLSYLIQKLMFFIYWAILYKNKKGTVNLSNVKSNIDLFCKDIEPKSVEKKQK